MSKMSAGLFNRWQRKAINYFIAVMRSWSPEERQAVFMELWKVFGHSAREAGLEMLDKHL
jgi:hypothetical protein